jgi:hypothetical protein
MNIDPQKFLIGLMDLFSILVPGALPTWLWMGQVGLVVSSALDQVHRREMPYCH